MPGRGDEAEEVADTTVPLAKALVSAAAEGWRWRGWCVRPHQLLAPPAHASSLLHYCCILQHIY